VTIQRDGWTRHPLFWASFHFAVSAGIVGMYLADMFVTMDRVVYSLLAHWQTDLFTAIMAGITNMGGSEGLVPLGALLVVGAFVRGLRIEAIILLMTLVGGDILSDFAKDTFNRPRPVGLNLIELPDSAAFPSGHAMVGGAFYMMLAFMISRRLSDRPYAGWLVSLPILLLALISISRVYLGVHYASDVIAGLSFGAVWYCFMRYVYEHAGRRWLSPQQNIHG
jgi:membrane-associated phospholipid phosphatase